MDALDLYRKMARARAFELAQAGLWYQGHISGEMHLGTGEEAVAAGVATLLRPGDAVSLDHRPTPVLTALGVPLLPMLKEVLGRKDGLCGGWGGHMHLFSREHLAASSGIVGASGPCAVGLALAAQRLRPGSVAVAFFGDGACNQGMMMEAWNLAALWQVPALFVCKDNGWAITMRQTESTRGSLLDRARAFGLDAVAVDGGDAVAVREVAERLIERARDRAAPAFLLARCPRLDGHFLGDPLVRIAHSPIGEGSELLGKVLSAATRSGGGLGARARRLGTMMGTLLKARGEGRDGKEDPLPRMRERLGKKASEVEQIDVEVAGEIDAVVDAALAEAA